MYKLITPSEVFYGERKGDAVKFPKAITKFRFWLWLTNPYVRVVRYKKDIKEVVFYQRYRKLLNSKP